ncbi:twin-arginine translocase TatA/TatE family subunit [Desulfurispirillum indicum]|uniref:Sec-independent protein translocase protein TatA n=1 Tax=Desulfurispirillum indicum (strain ATCC BAA-1389 / DSM 22839 / S5) TaxID=653733 RepID=E6W514_DESIS|nr:twin-arginine translocase TatA/TatE family subunit [Desulfurispirillum indicum]ADU65990.1 twin-arginine translocation protein, TatA/E family subunit [Desulfurispirillum indicum S5]UCZ57929.1 twin-arginine translocase TatA/TatE family subunit [Desulfurispirillum indicum]
MFNIGLPELLVIMVVALLIIGPKKLPDVAKSLGKGFGEFKRAMNDLRDTVNIHETGPTSNQRENAQSGNNRVIDVKKADESAAPTQTAENPSAAPQENDSKKENS